MTKKIAILGAGICGLSAAWFLQRRFGSDISISIFDKQPKVGGWLQTVEKQGATFECGPRTIRAQTAELQELIHLLGLDEAIVRTAVHAKTRYIAHEGVLKPLPTSLVSLFATELGRKLLYTLVREPWAFRSRVFDESVQSFFERRIGKSATNLFISALCAGVYAASPEELSMHSAFPSLWQKEQEYGSLLLASLFGKKKPPETSFTFRSGMHLLPKTLASKLQANIILNQKVQHVAEEGSCVLVDDEPFDFLFSTIAPKQLALLLPQEDRLRALLAIPQTSVVSVSLAFKEALKVPEGFGFLCPQAEDAILLGVIFDSCLFPEQNGSYPARLTFMMGGSKKADLISFSDQVLLAYAFQFMEKYLGISAVSDEHLIVRAHDAISRYPVGHQHTLKQLDQSRRIRLLGSGLYGVSVGDAVTSACNEVKNFVI